MKWIDPKKFKCESCGQCCRQIVILNKTDIKRMEKIGLKKKEFLDYDPMSDARPRKDTIKQVNNLCMFLYNKENKYLCKIYENRPKVCRRYPFYKKELKLETCKPKYYGITKTIKELMQRDKK